jgi:hypothetical protein
MADLLIVVDEKHPLRSQLATIVASLGGDSYHLLTTQEAARQLTPALLAALPLSTVILFLPLTVVTPSFQRRRWQHPILGKREVWIATPSLPQLPTVLTSLIGSFLEPREQARAMSVSKEWRQAMRTDRRSRWRDAYNQLHDKYGDVIGDFKEFYQPTGPLDEHVTAYQLYGEIYLRPPSPHDGLELVCRPMEATTWKILGKTFSRDRLIALLLRMDLALKVPIRTALQGQRPLRSFDLTSAMRLSYLADGWFSVHHTADSQWLAHLLSVSNVITMGLRYRLYSLIAWKMREPPTDGREISVITTDVSHYGVILSDIIPMINAALLSTISDEEFREVMEGAYYLGWRPTPTHSRQIRRQRPAMTAVLTTLASTEPATREGIPPLPVPDIEILTVTDAWA